MWLTKSSKNNFFAAHAKGNRQHDDVQNWCLCLKEWGNCLLYTVTCYVLVSSHYFFFNTMFFTLFYIILNLSLTFAHYLLLACGWVGSLWKKSRNSMYENNKQFISNTTE